MLSNTATPKYYGMFRDQVLRGEIPVCHEIEMQMNLIDNLIADPRIYYDDKAVEGWIQFCENELCLTDGSKLNLLPSFKLWGEDLLGWYYFIDAQVPIADNYGVHYEIRKIKQRLRKKQYLIVGRGAAKSLYDTCIHAYGLVVDKHTTHQVATAPTMKQSEEVMDPLRTALIRSRGPLFKFLTMGSIQNTTGSKATRPKLVSTKKGIENLFTNSLLEVRPMSIHKLQGLRVKYATIDEWLSGTINDDVMGAIEQGASKGQILDYIILATSSEGTVRNGPGDTIKLELMSILKGEYYAPQTSIWWYKLDDMSEVGDPSKWIKANPNIGKTVSYEAYQMDVERAQNAPATKNDILAKRFGIPMEGSTYFFTYEETLPHEKRDYWQMRCALGADLSQGDDFCAFTFLFPLPNGCIGIKTRSYISERTYTRLQPAMKLKYDTFIDEGSLIVMDGVVLDMTLVYEDVDKFIMEKQYDVCCFGYDPYNAKDFVDLWTQQNGEFGVTKVIQGSRTESVPLGELKNLAREKMILFDENLMKFAMGNCVVSEDTNGNRKLQKKRHEEKIDNVAAMMDAWVAYKLNKDMFE
ncbi:terminase TerL endonuclease subunit [Segatella bryantii]|uniref:terminase TerL endonuclease subunit n=1 Tax=Segatella bryantii TaxID=77095 RepID=UPI00242D0E48|nr:terminase TerL endonuclease subunit [Segatella bryantii]